MNLTPVPCSCGAPIIWAVTILERKTPLNAEPVKMQVIIGVDIDGLPLVQVKDCYVPHWADCPHAAKHRKSP